MALRKVPRTKVVSELPRPSISSTRPPSRMPLALSSLPTISSGATPLIATSLPKGLDAKVCRISVNSGRHGAVWVRRLYSSLDSPSNLGRCVLACFRISTTPAMMAEMSRHSRSIAL